MRLDFWVTLPRSPCPRKVKMFRLTGEFGTARSGYGAVRLAAPHKTRPCRPPRKLGRSAGVDSKTRGTLAGPPQKRVPEVRSVAVAQAAGDFLVGHVRLAQVLDGKATSHFGEDIAVGRTFCF